MSKDNEDAIIFVEPDIPIPKSPPSTTDPISDSCSDSGNHYNFASATPEVEFGAFATDGSDSISSFVQIPPSDGGENDNCTLNEEHPPNSALQCLERLDGLHFVSKDGVHVMTPIYLSGNPGSRPGGDGPFYIIHHSGGYCFSTSSSTTHRMAFVQGSLDKFTAELPIINTWYCCQSRDRTMTVSLPDSSENLGSLEIPQDIPEKATLRNILSGRTFFTKPTEAGILIYDCANPSRPAAEALGTSGVTTTEMLMCMPLSSKTVFDEFKMVFDQSANLTVTDKALMMALMRAWVFDMRHSARQKKCMYYLSCLVIAVVTFTVGMLTHQWLK